MDDFQLQAAAGFAVIYCNPRGSSGYSQQWGRAIRGPECAQDPGSGWRGADFADVLACAADIAGFIRSDVGPDHLENPGACLRHSPVSYVRDMTAPLLVLHSEDDLRRPVSQAEELFVALRLLGRDPVMYRFPGENHELTRSGSPRHRIARAELLLEWFRRHLGDGAGDSTAE